MAFKLRFDPLAEKQLMFQIAFTGLFSVRSSKAREQPIGGLPGADRASRRGPGPILRRDRRHQRVSVRHERRHHPSAEMDQL